MQLRVASKKERNMLTRLYAISR